MLQPGVKIWMEQTHDSVWLSSGTIRVNETVMGMAYKDNSFKPLKPWSAPTEEERRILFDTSRDVATDYSRNISVVRLPDELIKKLRAFNLHKFCSQADALNFKNNKPDQFAYVDGLLRDFMEQYQVRPEEVQVHLFYVGAPGLESSTIDFGQKLRVGLHVDSWYNAPIENTGECCNRICFNLGSQDRYFLFVNQPLQTIYQWVKERKPVPPDYNQHALVRDFLALFPEYKVVKLKIRPHEAYIAPTENIIHDGCTDGNSEMDVSLTARGYFWIAGKITDPELV